MSSSVFLIVLIVIILACLVCYALISQSLASKREHRERIEGALLKKARNFKFMLHGFPKGFLPPELTLLIQKSLLEIYSQLCELNPAEPQHRTELQTLSKEMSDARRGSSNQNKVRLQSPQQIVEVKSCLEELHKYIFQLEAKGRIQKQNADAHRASIRELVVNITVDSYDIAGKEAAETNKPRLALHNLQLALNMMERERSSGNFNQRISELQQQCAVLQKKIQDMDESSADDENSTDKEEREEKWNEFDKESDSQQWQKKQVYD